MSDKNLQILLAGRPSGWVEERHFRLVETPIPAPREGEVLVRNHYLSLDPYMRGRMNAARSYAPPAVLDEVMIGATAGEVLHSRHPDFAVGDRVVGRLGWQLYAVSDGAGLRKVDARIHPLTSYLGVLGMTGVTAWHGLMDICAPQHGETVVVTAAAGAVGSVVGQLAKIHGCRAVGIAGGPEKCRHVVEDLGFDACIDYKNGQLREDLTRHVPQGVDCLFENVGGEIFDALLGRMNAHARIALCGLISQYNSAPVPLKNSASLLINRIKLQGFIITEQAERWPVALAELSRYVADGKIRYRETMAHGLEQAPAAFIGLLKGQNVGKQLVRLL